MNWFKKNFKTLIYCSFIVPILTVAIVSISHVTKWYGISNPLSWAIYLSVGVEIAALSALAAISAKMGKKVYFPFIIVTLIQFIGNIFFAYQYIDINSITFKDWVDLVNPIVSYLGVDPENLIGHKRFLALFAGGMLPLISLSFLHMLVKFEEEEKNNEVKPVPVVDIEDLSIKAGLIESELVKEEERGKYNPTKEDIQKLEMILKGYEGPKEQINQDTPYLPSKEDLSKLEEYLNVIQEKKFGTKESLGNIEESNPLTSAKEMMITTDEDIINSIPADDEVSIWDETLYDGLEDLPYIPTEEEEKENYSTLEPIQETTETPSNTQKINRLSYTRRDG